MGKILVYSAELLRFIFTINKDFDQDYSYAVIKPLDNWNGTNFEIDEETNKLILKTENLWVEVKKNPFNLLIKENHADGKCLIKDNELGMAVCYNSKDRGLRSYKKLEEKDHFYGFGEKTGSLDKKGELLFMDGRDMPYKGDVEPLYQNHPYFIRIKGGIAYGVFLDNISRTCFDMGKSQNDEYFFGVEKGDLNYYFIYGPSINEILERYTELTGRIEMPPKWAIGFHQCRYSYKNEQEIKEITSKFRESQIPCDNIWFDIHYMEGYRCFTFNKDRFPDPKRLMAELQSEGFKPFVIVDPGIKVDKDYSIYRELMQNEYYAPRKDGAPALGLVWPGLTHFPDFTRPEVRKWWAEKHQFYYDLGVAAIWNDMNEPAFSINPIISFVKRLHHEDMYLWDQGRHTIIKDCKNIYAICEAEATWMSLKKFRPNKRPFILTRSGYSGLQRYAAIWTGDNWTNWYNITLATKMLVNMNLSAQVFVGADVGGFAGVLKFIPKILRDKKQFIRWIQSGAFHPFFRIHTALGTKAQDPFSYGKKAQKIAKKYIELRYQLLPYWYNLFYLAHIKGEPILRPLFYHTPRDEACYDLRYQNQFFVGKDLLIVPIDKRNLKTKAIYLPEGQWIHYWTLEEYEGKMEHFIPISLQDLPIFVRKGAILPMQPVVEYIGQMPIETLILKIYKGVAGSSTKTFVYEDDGESMDYFQKSLSCILEIVSNFSTDASEIKILPLKGNYNPPWKQITCILYDIGEKIKEETVNFSKNGMDITL